MNTCPSCRRPVAAARPTCLYCGVPLPAEAVAEAAAAGQALAEAEARGRATVAGPAASAGARDRRLLVLDLSGAQPRQLEQLLDLPPFEAGQRARSGGLHLHRIGDEAEVAAEARRLQAGGLHTLSFPESEARQPPAVATSGRWDGPLLRLKTSLGTLDLEKDGLLLVVEGPIQREYQSREVERKKPRTATLETGYRFHLHRSHDLRPVELDPAGFHFPSGSGAAAGSSLLQMKEWIAALGDAPVDDTFRRLPAALAPVDAADEASSLLKRMGRGFSRAKDAVPILDNLAQFRFWSGWRAAAIRRLPR